MDPMIGKVLQIIFCFQVTNDDHPDYYRTVSKSRSSAQGRLTIYSGQKQRQGTADRINNSGDRRDVTSKWSCSTCVHTSEVALSRPPSVKQATCDGKQHAASERTFQRPSNAGRTNQRRITKFGRRNDSEDRSSRSRSNPRRVVSSLAFATVSEKGFSLSSNRTFVTRNQLKNVSSHTESEFMTRIKNKLYARDSGFDLLIKSSNNSLKRLETSKKPRVKKQRRRVGSSKDGQEQLMSCENRATQSVFNTEMHSSYCRENNANESSHLLNVDRKSLISEPAQTISETTLEQLVKYTVFKSKCYKSSNSGKSYQKFKSYFADSNNVLPSMRSGFHDTSEKPSQRQKTGCHAWSNADKLYDRTEKECQKSGESERFYHNESHDFHHKNKAKKSTQRIKNSVKPNSSVKTLNAKLNISDNSFYSSKTEIQTSSLSFTSGNNSDRSVTVVLTRSSHKSMKVTTGRSTNHARSKTNSRVSESSWRVARHTESSPLLTTKSTLSSWSDDSSQSSE